MSTNRSGGRLRFLDQSDAEAALLRARLEAVTRLAALTNRTRLDVEREAAALGLSAVTLYKLLRRYLDDPKPESVLEQRRGWTKGRPRLDSQTTDIITAAIDDTYLTREKPPVSKLVREINGRLRRAGLKEVMATTVQRRVDLLPIDLVLKRREGSKAARDAVGPHTCRYEVEHPLDVIQIDHTLADVIVLDDLFRQPIGRPWLTLAIDIRTRMVFGFHATLRAPCECSVAYALEQGIRAKAAWLAARDITTPWPVFGVPQAVHLDNAREFRARGFLWGCRRHGIKPVPRPVKVPHVGGHIERLIGRLMGEVHLLPGTTFSDPRQRGEYDAEGRARITQSEFERWMALQIVGIYHASQHRQLLRPPVAVWDEAIAALPAHRRREPPASDDPLLLDFLPFRTPAVDGQTIQLFNLVYHDPILKHWQVRREKPIVRYDKRDMSQVWVFDEAADRYWPIGLRDPVPGPMSFWEHQQARQALRAQGYREADQKLVYETILECRALVAEGERRTKQARRGLQSTLEAFRSLDLMDAPSPAALPLSTPPMLRLPPPEARAASTLPLPGPEQDGPVPWPSPPCPPPADLANEVEEW
ncbi:Mu transposase C-terminal domain-containing protein [Azospirillum agricola]|uniref:Mu transposase C-terminal domain-containing protein n=1 Tax=Azospirillum agricola TaxID=1720247 RepID=UPI000A0F23C4|nr:Mu transposase C-terminal domain-containing protein [Azospirillum agricola]SMH61466.1 putative transposase [Azospirillum lipoferum]